MVWCTMQELAVQARQLTMLSKEVLTLIMISSLT